MNQFIQTPDGVNLAWYHWLPTAHAQGSVSIVHGLSEHLGRYESLAEALTTAGWDVRGCDLRGHGHSSGTRTDIPSFSAYTDDLTYWWSQAPAASSPHVLLGHSLGGLIALSAVLQHSVKPDAVVLASPALRPGGHVPAGQMRWARHLAHYLPRCRLSAALDPANLTADTELQKAHANDPLAYRYPTFRLVDQVTKQMLWVLRQQIPKDLPILVLVGSDDAVVDTRTIIRWARRARHPSSTLHIYDGTRHEVFQDLERERVIEDLIGWLSRL